MEFTSIYAHILFAVPYAITLFHNTTLYRITGLFSYDARLPNAPSNDISTWRRSAVEEILENLCLGSTPVLHNSATSAVHPFPESICPQTSGVFLSLAHLNLIIFPAPPPPPPPLYLSLSLSISISLPLASALPLVVLCLFSEPAVAVDAGIPLS